MADQTPVFGYDPETKSYDDSSKTTFGDRFTGESPLGQASALTPKAVKLIEERGKAGEEETRLLGEKGKAQEKYINRGLHILEEPLPAHAQLEKLKAAPNPEDYKKYSMEFLGAMTLVGAFAGRKSRNAGNAALKAFTGAMTGWQQGNLEAYAQATKQWEENTKALIENNRIELERYLEVSQDRSRSIDEVKLGLLLAGMKSENGIMVQQGKMGNIDAQLQLINTLQNTTAKIDRTTGFFGRQHAETEKQLVQQASEIQFNGGKAFLDAQVASGQMDDRQYRHYQWVLENYGPGTVIAKRVTEGAQPRSPAALATKKFMEEHPKATAEEIAKFNAEQAGNLSALRAAGTRAGGIETAAAAFSRSIPLAREASENVPRGKFVPINRLANQYRSLLSNPAYKRFYNANETAITEYAFLIGRGNSGVTVHAQQRAEKILNTADSDEAYQAGMDQLEMEAEAISQAPADARENLLKKLFGEGEGAKPSRTSPAPASSGIPAGWSVERH